MPASGSFAGRMISAPYRPLRHLFGRRHVGMRVIPVRSRGAQAECETRSRGSCRATPD